MATLLEKYTTEEQRPFMHFLWTKGSNAKDIHEQIFPLHDGKWFSPKAVQNRGEKLPPWSQTFR
jgi:hypothetical protein